MFNGRLPWYLENHMAITKFQSGFRRRRSTVDNLVTLKPSIRDAFGGRKHLVSIFLFFWRYDTTWKHGILLDLYKTAFRGRLPVFICNFYYLILVLKFMSGIYTLRFTYRRQMYRRVVFFSVTLFSLKINGIVSCLLPDIKCSIYVDYLEKIYSSINMPSIERKLQESLKRLGRWCDENGFKFSSIKTYVCSVLSITKTSFRSSTLPKWHTNSNHR